MSESGFVSINAAWNGTVGLVEVPVNYATDIVDFLESYFSTIASSFTLNNQVFFENLDLDPVTFTNNGTLGGFEEITNVGTGGSVGTGSFTFDGTVNSLAVALAVEAPGNITLTGAASTATALFGSSSNVAYTVTDGVASSIFAGGGADSITLYASSTTLNDTILSSGADTVNIAQGSGSVNVIAMTGADDNITINDASTTVTATGNSTVGIHWESPLTGGAVYFVNQSTASSTVFSGIFGSGSNAQASAPQVTAFGGAGGGFFLGGQRGGAAGINLLVGGSPGSVSVSSTGQITQVSSDSTAGLSTLVGGADGSILDAQGYGPSAGGGQNFLFAGSGQETLLATSTTDDNLFQLGLNYPGLGQPQSNGLVSTAGAGTQTFFLGNSAGATLYGSTATNAANVYNFVSDATAGGGVFSIENFASSTSAIYLVDAADTASGTASLSSVITSPFNSNDVLIGLTDGTQITLKNTSLNDVHTATTSSGITVIY